MIPERLRTRFESKIEFIEKLDSISVDIDKLLEEFELVRHLLVQKKTSGTLVQKKLGILQQNIYHPVIENLPYTKQIIEKLGEYYPYNSVYYRIVMPLTCYPWHSDPMHSCLHIPLQTNLGCRFIYENCAFHMPADGSVYLVNNQKSHTVANAGPTERLHITLDIL